ncbi:hypothetical protein ABVK25_007325 [Lepraria finkii]|uniref:Glycosyl transferase family 3 domain-containing protein n=1 Tax=Lepraria finkii TaxID=1340010 RepID=A0ABR4B3I3_9LECA
MSSTTPHSTTVNIVPLLKKLHKPEVHGLATAEEISPAFALIFEENRLSPIQAAAFLTLLSTTSRDKDANVIAACAARMRDVASPVDLHQLQAIMHQRAQTEGAYHGGLCDIVGTGGSSIQTYNVSTTASLIASSFLLMSKHGNKAQTSVSGAADILSSIAPTPPDLLASNAENIPAIYEESSYAFLFAPNFHPGMRFAAPLRREMGIRTIFNLLGPLAHPIEELVEARLVGVTETSLGDTFAHALAISSKTKAPGRRKAMVVCARAGLDEIACEGVTDCWMLYESEDEQIGIRQFALEPHDFGFPNHPLSAIRGGDAPKDNAVILMQMLEGKLDQDDPILQVVLMNTAAMLVVSGVCEAESSHTGERDGGIVIQERGPGGGRWKEGVRRARLAVKNGAALRSLGAFTEVSNSFGGK